MRMRALPKLNTGLVALIRHRAANYALGLSKGDSDKVVHELRTLMSDMLGPDEVMELTAAWLKVHRKDAAIQVIERGKRARRPLVSS